MRSSRKPTALYAIAYAEVALKYLEGLRSVKIRRQIKSRIDALVFDPFPAGSKKLENVTDHRDPVYRVRSGDYRVLYVVRSNAHQIVVLDIGDRKDIYR